MLLEASSRRVKALIFPQASSRRASSDEILSNYPQEYRLTKYSLNKYHNYAILTCWLECLALVHPLHASILGPQLHAIELRG